MWPTRDHVIPHQLFRHFEREIGRVGAWEQLRAMQAAAHGQAVAMNGSHPSVVAETRRLSELAFPLVRVPGAHP